MQCAAHAFSQHIEKPSCLARNKHVPPAEDIAVDKGRTEILGAALQPLRRLQLHAMKFLQILFHLLMRLVEVSACWKANPNDLLSVPFMAPSIVTKSRMKPEMEVLPV